VLAVRNPDKGRAAARAITGATTVLPLDLARLASVRAFAQSWDDGEIDLLINNAGTASPALSFTADGFESQFGTNHLGHFALTNLLLPHISGRIVTLASQAERMGGFNWENLAWDRGGYTPSKAYNRSKLANLLFSAELQRRLRAAGSPVLAQCAHPGFVATPIYAESGGLAKFMVRTVAQAPEQGAQPVLYAAVADIPGDSFAGPGRMMHMRGAPELIKRSKAARGPELAARLWSVSEELTGVTWPATLPALRTA
jgi:NAD(P)-dependent dehydrogenase (short-subunit alcohol dehydrogenase family)